MVIHTINNKTHIAQYNTLADFYTYICDTPINEAFRWATHQSSERSEYRTTFTGTDSLDGAIQIMHDGWTVMAQKLQKQLKGKPITAGEAKQMETYLSVAGFQPVVPLYLSGVPANMVSKRMVIKKQKVLEVTKLIQYSATVDTETIVEESIKAIRLVQKLEQQGYKIALNIACVCTSGNTTMGCKIRIKNPNERIQISKLAFPLVHPSMLRRLYFRFVEVFPYTTSAYTTGYGCPVSLGFCKKYFKGDIVIPPIWDVDVDNITDLSQIQ